MNVYFAGRFSRREELLGYKEALEEMAPDYGAEITVTSRWLLGGHEWSGTADEEVPLDECARFAQEDLHDLMRAHVIVCFTEPPRSGPARGGRHVEMGYALAAMKPVLCVGYRENVFYCLPQVHFVPTWSQAEEWLLSRSITDVTKLMARTRAMERLYEEVVDRFARQLHDANQSTKSTNRSAS